MKKRKWIILFIAVIVFLLCLVLLLPIPVQLKQEITIESSLMNVSEQVTDLRNWKKWHPALIKRDTSSIRLSGSPRAVNALLQLDHQEFTTVNVNPISITLKEMEENKETYQSFNLVPDSAGNQVHIIWSKVITPYIWLTDRHTLLEEMRTGLANLKKSLEDPIQFYGFPIQIRPVTDTLVIIKTAIVSDKEIPSALQKLFGDLNQFVKENNINGNVQRISGHVPSSKINMVELNAGLVVNKRVPEKNGIKYLKMPPIGRMLVGEYDGDYHNIQLLYRSIERYMSDKHLRKVALPYEKYLSDPQSPTDSLHMRMEIYYPIY